MKSFMKIKKDNLSLAISIICLVGVIYLIFYDQVLLPKKLGECNDTAISLEKMRHPYNDTDVTNEDITKYMKNMISCFSG